MSTYQLNFICKTCQDKNKSKLGMPGFELLQTNFENLTSAIEHFLETKENIYSSTHELEPEITEYIDED